VNFGKPILGALCFGFFMKHVDRTEALRRLVREAGASKAFLIFNQANLFYFTGFQGASALYLPLEGQGTMFVYSVNYAQAEAECREVNVQLVKPEEDVIAKVAACILRDGVGCVLADALSFDGWRKLMDALGGKVMVEVDAQAVGRLRQVKDEDELTLMRKACELTSLGMKVAYETLQPGIREYELAAEVEYAMRKHGSGGTAFESIVASGLSSAYPHGGCTDRCIRSGELVVVDVGAVYGHYCADMTRTFVAGKPVAKQERLYAMVKAAQDAALSVIRPGVAARDVDVAARRVLVEAGYGENFVHALGHGVGIEVHEPPALSQTSRDVLRAGNVVTVEPGVYLVGYGGVRIEDTVLIRAEGVEKLTRAGYGLRGEQS
jgi:Xaa-Pro dipeptidase